MRDAETTLAIVRRCGTVSRLKALKREDDPTSPRDEPTSGEHGAERPLDRIYWRAVCDESRKHGLEGGGRTGSRA